MPADQSTWKQIIAAAENVVATPGWLGVATTYVGLGVKNSIFGVDHLLFVPRLR
jgi:hypothetical protein